jgi:hypothetical protein
LRPDRQGAGIGKALVDAVSVPLKEWGVHHAGLFTFAHSPLHLALYQKSGFHARFLTAIMAAPAQPRDAALRWLRYSELPEADRGAAEVACSEVTEALYEGLDLSAEIRTVAVRNLGDTLLLWDGASHIAGFAVCHWGLASEAGEGCCFAVRPGPKAADRFARLLDACGALAISAGMPTMLAGVNLAREEAYRHMVTRGFRTEIQGVTMHWPNDWGYSRPGLYVIDDWR